MGQLSGRNPLIIRRMTDLVGTQPIKKAAEFG